MDAKLTLSLNSDIIDRAKSYAKGQHTSISHLVENYLAALTSPNKKVVKPTPLVKSLTGVIPDVDLDDESIKGDYYDYLVKKYS